MSATTSTRPAVDVTSARRKLARLRDALVRADNLLVDYWRSDEWRAFGHSTWRAFVEAELPELRALKVRPEVRDAKVVELVRDHGMSQGAAADALGIGKATANRALEGLELPDTVQASDGRTMAARQRPATKRRRGPRKTDKAVELAQAVETFDVRDVVAATRWPQHKASATLTRLVQQGRLEYLPPERRGLFGRYRVVAEVAG